MFLWDQGVYVCWEFVSFVRDVGGGLDLSGPKRGWGERWV
jgi:hypothetical protein